MIRFRDIVGQEQIKNGLLTAIRQDKISHAYILAGEKGMGKMTIALAFAAALLCGERGRGGENEVNGKWDSLSYADDSCGQCSACKRVETLSHPDLKIVNHEKPRTVIVDDIRYKILSDINIKPYEGGKKIYIVPDAELMNPAAQNALLKTLEEPPPYAVILLLTTNAKAFLDTILSRSVTLPLRPVPDSLLTEYLEEGRGHPYIRAKAAAAASRGNIGKAIMAAEDEEYDRRREKAVEVIAELVKRPMYQTMEMVGEIVPGRNDRTVAIEYTDTLRMLMRDIMVYKATGRKEDLILYDKEAYIRNVAESAEYRGVNEAARAIDECASRIYSNVSVEHSLNAMMESIRECLTKRKDPDKWQ